MVVNLMFAINCFLMALPTIAIFAVFVAVGGRQNFLARFPWLRKKRNRVLTVMVMMVFYLPFYCVALIILLNVGQWLNNL